MYIVHAQLTPQQRGLHAMETHTHTHKRTVGVFGTATVALFVPPLFPRCNNAVADGFCVERPVVSGQGVRCSCVRAAVTE